ncbi:SpoIIE family protein phosphatase [Thermodesulfobacteriota bacterium]
MTGEKRKIRPASGQKAVADPRKRSAFFADLRHELRTPLNAIIGYSEMLLEDSRELNEEVLFSGLKKTHSAGNQLLDRINSILDPKKIEAGQIEPDLEAFRARMLHEIQTPVNTVIDTSKILIEKARDSELETAISDLEKILSAGERFLMFINGIVDFFATGNDGIDTVQQRSDTPQLTQKDAGVARPGVDEGTGHDMSGRSLLLVVDDNEENRDMLSRHLVRQGHDVLAAENGRQALDLIKQHEVDLILLDIKMPEMNGFQVLRHLKNDDTLRNLPVIMISAVDDMDSVARCIEMGAEDYLPKPFDPVLLKARISASLDKKRLREKEVSLMKAGMELADTIKESIKKTISDVMEGAKSDHNFEWIVPYMTEKRFKKGEYLFHKGDKADKMYYLKKGALRLIELDLVMAADNVLGETGILSPRKERTISVVCEEDSEIFILEEHEAIDLFYEKPSLLFELVQISIHRTIENLKATVAEKERIESDLRVAHDIQESMLPSIFPPFPDRKEFDIFASMEAAREVGGDFFDFFFIGENKLCFMIGDVSGKGVPAALFMAITKAILKTEALRGFSPEEILCNANDIIAPDNHTAMFVTILCAILNTKTGEMEFGNAGHNLPLIYKDGKDFEYHKLPPGFVLGPMEDVAFASGKMVLNQNDIVFFYTDGVTEAENPKKQLYSDQRLQECLSNLKGHNVTEMIHGVREDVRGFAQSAPQSDDITMLALKYHGNM